MHELAQWKVDCNNECCKWKCIIKQGGKLAMNHIQESLCGIQAVNWDTFQPCWNNKWMSCIDKCQLSAWTCNFPSFLLFYSSSTHSMSIQVGGHIQVGTDLATVCSMAKLKTPKANGLVSNETILHVENANAPTKAHVSSHWQGKVHCFISLVLKLDVMYIYSGPTSCSLIRYTQSYQRPFLNASNFDLCLQNWWYYDCSRCIVTGCRWWENMHGD